MNKRKNSKFVLTIYLITTQEITDIHLITIDQVDKSKEIKYHIPYQRYHLAKIRLRRPSQILQRCLLEIEVHLNLEEITYKCYK